MRPHGVYLGPDVCTMWPLKPEAVFHWMWWDRR